MTLSQTQKSDEDGNSKFLLILLTSHLGTQGRLVLLMKYELVPHFLDQSYARF